MHKKPPLTIYQEGVSSPFPAWAHHERDDRAPLRPSREGLPCLWREERWRRPASFPWPWPLALARWCAPVNVMDKRQERERDRCNARRHTLGKLATTSTSAMTTRQSKRGDRMKQGQHQHGRKGYVAFPQPQRFRSFGRRRANKNIPELHTVLVPKALTTTRSTKRVVDTRELSVKIVFLCSAEDKVSHITKYQDNTQVRKLFRKKLRTRRTRTRPRTLLASCTSDIVRTR